MGRIKFRTHTIVERWLRTGDIRGQFLLPLLGSFVQLLPQYRHPQENLNWPLETEGCWSTLRWNEHPVHPQLHPQLRSRAQSHKPYPNQQSSLRLRGELEGQRICEPNSNLSDADNLVYYLQIRNWGSGSYRLGNGVPANPSPVTLLGTRASKVSSWKSAFGLSIERVRSSQVFTPLKKCASLRDRFLWLKKKNRPQVFFSSFGIPFWSPNKIYRFRRSG